MLGPAVGAPLLSALLATLRPTLANSSLDGDLSTLSLLNDLSTLDDPSAPLEAQQPTAPAGGGAGGALAAPVIANGACATLWVFAGAALLCAGCTTALPRLVDGPRRSTLLQGGASSRSDHVEQDDA